MPNDPTVGKFTRTRSFYGSLEGGGDYRIPDSGSVETAVRQEGFVRPLLVPPTEAFVRIFLSLDIGGLSWVLLHA